MEITTEEEILNILDKYGISSSTFSGGVRRTEGLAQYSVEIWGSGKPMREFLWSEDMADACVYLMEKVDFSNIVVGDVISSEGEKSVAQNEIRNTHINIGTGKEISIKELAAVIKKTVGFQGELVFNSSKPDGTMRKLTDSSKLAALGWKYTVELEEGIKRMYDWYLEK